MHQPGYIQEGQETIFGYLLLGVYYRNSPGCTVVVDASATHVGACLQQRLPGRKAWQPLGFFSKKLEAAQQKYSAFDRELFACFAGIRHFRYMLDGRRFAIFTDQKRPRGLRL